MFGRKIMLLLLLLVAFAAQAWSAVDVYVNPGISLYGDGMGYSVLTGAKVPFTTFGLNLPLFAGGTLFVSGGGAAKTQVFTIGGGGDIGYRLALNLNGHELDIDSLMTLGMSYESLQEVAGGSVANIGFMLLPRVDVNYQITPLFGMGLETGYHADFYPTHVIANFYVDLNLNFRIGSSSVKKMESKIKVSKKKVEKKKSKGLPEIALYVDGKELINKSGKIDFGSFLTNAEPITTNLVVSNLGTSLLKIKGFSVLGEGFSLTGTEIFRIKPKESAEFTLKLSRLFEVDNKDAKLTILSDDADESDYTVLISGVVSEPLPAITETNVVEQTNSVMTETNTNNTNGGQE